MSDEQGERRHAPTPHRRQEARRQGQVPRSQELISAGLLFGGLLLLNWLGRGLADFCLGFADRQWDGGTGLRIDADLFVEQMRGTLGELAAALMPLLGLLLLLALALNLAQTGWLVLPHKLAWDLGRLSPLEGWNRIFSADGLMRLAQGLLKLTVVIVVAGVSLWAQREHLVGLSAMEPSGTAAGIVRITCGVCLRVAGALLVLAAGDYAWQWWRHEQRLRMTDQELREELRSLQGDPQLAARRRALRQGSEV